ncbi:Protein arginine N-methyltransferase skb1 [Elsinoe australis]|uniref:Protein arginine N-methyltransferase n=1 Tax=Elsinoe australis TaxID=40998 RepID=A0A2P8AFN5_9PEZI|nr:Protein arginine N-methyltransferase skb1 [Elsinoe australis]
MDPSEAPMLPQPVFYIGHHDTNREDVVSGELMDQARIIGYDMITTRITNTAFRDHVQKLCSEHQAVGDSQLPMPIVTSLGPEYTSLGPSDATPSMIATVSPWADVSSSDPVVAHLSRQVVSIEVAYAAFCGISNVILPPLFRDGTTPDAVAVSRYADVVSQSLSLGPYLQVLAPFPMDDQKLPKEETVTFKLQSSAKHATEKPSEQPGSDPFTTWDAWNHVRIACNYAAKLALVLIIPRLLPSDHLQSRWYSEPLRILTLPASSFAANPNGHPVLSKAHQAMLTKYMRLQMPPWLLLSGSSELPQPDYSTSEPTPAEAAQLPVHPPAQAPRLAYLRYFQRTQPPLPPLARFAQGYQDFLQSPLQPLTDNLESITYEVFEKDPIKYAWYEQAIALALKDLYSALRRPIVVAVVGAGRGPLMTRSLMASGTTEVPILPYAIEKNPNAFVLLQRRNKTDPLWGGRVQVIKTDMRSWTGPLGTEGKPTKVDILVSELLGSFADNELSPECLDGVQHHLDPENGVSIPQSYTAWVTPIASPRIHADLLHRPSDPEKYNLPYVTMLHQFSYLSYTDRPLPPTPAGLISFEPSIQECWEFTHPLPTSVISQSDVRKRGGQLAPGLSGGDGWNEHNARSCHLTFPVGEVSRGVCHGLAGYFETVLYRSRDGSRVVELSTNPNTMDEKSKDMISWFPIFFPLKTPLYIPDGAEIRLDMYRKTDDRKVWYTWQAGVWVQVNSRWQRTGVSEVHSSAENGCLM